MWSGLISIVLLVIGALASIAGATVYIRSSWIKAQLSAANEALEGLRGDRDDLKARVDIVEDELAREKATTIELRQRSHILETIVTGREELARVLSILESRTQRFETIEDTLTEIKAIAQSVKTTVEATA